jgi:type I restriction enzyme, S subunit
MNSIRWPIVNLGDVASLHWRAQEPQPGKTYRLVGVRLWGKGAYVRETIDGSQTQYSKLFQVEEGDIIVNKIWARNGSVSVVGPDVAGAFGSSEFPTYVPNSKKLDPKWAYWFTRLASLWKQCEALSQGTSGQNRLRPDRFLEVKIPLPPLSEQRRIVAQLDAVAAGIEARTRKGTAMEAELAAALTSGFQKITAGAPRVRMAVVAPLVRRPVEIEPDGIYHELGVRSFGRGLFDKPPLTGGDLTWQKLFKIRKGDLVFSNIKAWEGAFAVAKPQDDGKVGSHRYLTCVTAPDRATPGFLWYYLQTKEGLEEIQAASPGSADRNRTLSQKGLEEIQIPVPAIDAQLWFDELQIKAAATRAQSAEAAAELGHLIPAMLNQVF